MWLDGRREWMIGHVPVAGLHVQMHDAVVAPKQVCADGDGRVGSIEHQRVRGIVRASDGADA